MSVDFEKLTPRDLAKAAVIPQVLDNQWVPNSLLKRMIKKKLSLHDVKPDLAQYVLKEWRRALVYSDQVIVNRTSMFNNEIIVDDYDGKANRESMKVLLHDRVIVPFLVFEDSPDQRPTFDLRDHLWDSWMDVIHGTRVSCVRLDWGGHGEGIRRISGTFHNYFQTLNTQQRAEHLAHNLGVPEKEFPKFRSRLKDVALYAFEMADKRLITRSDLYREFIVEEGTNVAEGRYSDKPYSAEIKQIVDLKYNVNIADALGRSSLTPEDSLPRSALGDLQESVQTNIISPENLKDILQALQRLAFDQISQGMYLKSLGKLTLADVVEIRNTSEWIEYKSSLHNLLNRPLDFSDRSAQFYSKYAALNKKITEVNAAIEQAKWEPWVKLLISVGAKAVEVAINPLDPSQKILTTMGTGSISSGVAPFLMRLAIGARTLTDADLDVSLDFMRGNVQTGRETWNEMLGQLRSTPGFKEIAGGLEAEFEPNQSPPENLSETYYGY